MKYQHCCKCCCNKCCCKRGPMGPQGLQGPQGIIGIQGPQGITGPDLCAIYAGATMASQIDENLLLLAKDPLECEFIKFSIKDLCTLCKIIGPQPTDCDNICKGVGLRYRNLDSDGGAEVYIGKGDLGIGANRVEKEYNWMVNPILLSTYNFVFTHDPVNNKTTQTLMNLGGAMTSVSSEFMNLVDVNGDITYCTVANCSVTKTVKMSELDQFELLVLNNSTPPNANNIVILTNLVLTTSAGINYTILNGGGPSFAPPEGSSIISKFTWPNDNSTPAEYFKFAGTIQISGIFSSAEAARVEIGIYKCVDM